MPNVKGALIAAAAALVISFVLSLVVGTPFPALVLRPVFFAILFFAIVLFFSFLSQRFLLDGNRVVARPPEQTGGAVNISVGDGMNDVNTDEIFTETPFASESAAGGLPSEVEPRSEVEQRSTGGLAKNNEIPHNDNGARSADGDATIAWLASAPEGDTPGDEEEEFAADANKPELSADGSHYLMMKAKTSKGTDFVFDAQEDGEKAAGAIRELLRKDN